MKRVLGPLDFFGKKNVKQACSPTALAQNRAETSKTAVLTSRPCSANFATYLVRDQKPILPHPRSVEYARARKNQIYQ